MKRRFQNGAAWEHLCPSFLDGVHFICVGFYADAPITRDKGE
jgi:hypothetical protein